MAVQNRLVDYHDGDVVLEGHVRTQEQLDRLLKITQHVRGVNQVVNKLHVSDEEEEPAPAWEGWRTRVRAALGRTVGR